MAKFVITYKQLLAVKGVNPYIKRTGLLLTKDPLDVNPLRTLAIDFGRQLKINHKSFADYFPYTKKDSKKDASYKSEENDIIIFLNKVLSTNFIPYEINLLAKHYSQGPLVFAAAPTSILEKFPDSELLISNIDYFVDMFKMSDTIYIKTKTNRYPVYNMSNQNETLIGYLEGPVETLFKLTPTGFELQSIQTDSKLLLNMFLGDEKITPQTIEVEAQKSELTNLLNKLDAQHKKLNLAVKKDDKSQQTQPKEQKAQLINDAKNLINQYKMEKMSGAQLITEIKKLEEKSNNIQHVSLRAKIVAAVGSQPKPSDTTALLREVLSSLQKIIITPLAPIPEKKPANAAKFNLEELASKPLPYTITPAELLKSNNEAILEDKLLFSRDKNADPLTTLRHDFSRKLLINHKTLQQHGTENIGEIKDFLIKEFNNHNFNLFQEHYSQAPMMFLYAALYPITQDKKIIIKLPEERYILRDLYKKETSDQLPDHKSDSAVYFKTFITKIPIQIYNEDDPTDEIFGYLPGSIQAIFKLTDKGFELSEVNTDSTYFRDILLGSTVSSSYLIFETGLDAIDEMLSANTPEKDHKPIIISAKQITKELYNEPNNTPKQKELLALMNQLQKIIEAQTNHKIKETFSIIKNHIPTLESVLSETPARTVTTTPKDEKTRIPDNKLFQPALPPAAAASPQTPPKKQEKKP